MGRGRWSVEGGEVVAAATPLLGSRKAGEKCLAKDFRFKSFFFPLFTTCRPPSSCNTWSLSATAVASRVCSTSPRPPDEGQKVCHVPRPSNALRRCVDWPEESAISGASDPVSSPLSRLKESIGAKVWT
ncbi:unnamed protein product [Protopolystoma xenopodis]|uniref:Uncharacterized protein n=1 Tax=Protopolystoma xenopodis TaxID=117903 RepID=A0A448XL57_9PLAT|nr:unnamed protein product [Protopolystoma xenopodis]